MNQYGDVVELTVWAKDAQGFVDEAIQIAKDRLIEKADRLWGKTKRHNEQFIVHEKDLFDWFFEEEDEEGETFEPDPNLRYFMIAYKYSV